MEQDRIFEWDEVKAQSNIEKLSSATNIASDTSDEMEDEYDFSAGVRGKHALSLQKGYRVIIHKQDGTTEEHDYRLPDHAVLLEPDVSRYFPDSETVNRALRGLIALIPAPTQASPQKPRKSR